MKHSQQNVKLYIGVLYTINRAVFYNHNVSKGRYLLFFMRKGGKGNSNLTGAFERCTRILCLYTERDSILPKVRIVGDCSLTSAHIKTNKNYLSEMKNAKMEINNKFQA
jgi:hypothetical protein